MKLVDKIEQSTVSFFDFTLQPFFCIFAARKVKLYVLPIQNIKKNMQETFENTRSSTKHTNNPT
jgi:hypothetical protein